MSRNRREQTIARKGSGRARVSRRVRRARSAAVIAVMSLALLLAALALSAPADLDTTFDGNGKVITPFSASVDTVNAIALQPDGKIVAAGASGSIFGVARYNPDGSLDMTFATDGKVTTAIGTGADAANALALQPDGKIVAAGFTSISGASDFDFAVARYVGDPKPNKTANFDTDRRTDISIWNPGNGNWVTNRSTDNSLTVRSWGSGALGDHAVPGDYDGDGRTDIAVFRPSDGNWYILKSSDSSVLLRHWGNPSDIPVPGDYDLDGKTDTALYRPSEGNWYILKSRDQSVAIKGWGASGDKPAPADYDGDGQTDFAVFRPAEGNWYIINSKDRFARIINWGASSDRLVPADYDGDGRVDVAVFRPSEGNWYVRL